MLSFTKIKFSGMNSILITESSHYQEPTLILDANDIERLIKVWENE